MIKKESSNHLKICILFEDPDNLNRWAMPKPLPTGWLELLYLEGFDLNQFIYDHSKELYFRY